MASNAEEVEVYRDKLRRIEQRVKFLRCMTPIVAFLGFGDKITSKRDQMELLQRDQEVKLRDLLKSLMGRDTLWIGVVGYSGQKFNTNKARKLLSEVFDEIERDYQPSKVVVVSGLTLLGVPHLAYEEAKLRNWETTGVACPEARNFKCFPVSIPPLIVGKNWGDESADFLEEIHVLVRIGGGEQANKEAETFRSKGGKIYVRELPAVIRSQ